MRAAPWLLLSLAACFPGRLPPQSEGEGEGMGEGEGDPVGEGEGEGQVELVGEGEGESESCLLDTNKPMPPATAVYFGVREPARMPLTSGEQRALVGVGIGEPPGASCSGTIVSTTVVLTAQHCTEELEASDFYITIGANDYDPVATIPVVAVREHPEFDIAVLVLDSRALDGLGITPIPIYTDTLTDNDIGTHHEQVGFGDTELGGNRGRFFVTEPMVAFEEPGGYLVVDGDDQRGVCFGDSGGPSLRLDASGRVRVAGVLGYGDPSCTGQDRYTRTDLVVDFIEVSTGVTPTAALNCSNAVLGCSADGRLSSSCTNDVVGRTLCQDDEVCRDDGCVAAAADPCGQETSFGRCDDGVLHWCKDNIAVRRDCESCGEICGAVDGVSGYACRLSACGDVTYLGQCDGNVATWCSSGVVQSETCANGCDFIDEDTGYYCIE
jgi:Trypsin